MFDPNQCIYSDQRPNTSEVKEEDQIFLSQPENISIPTNNTGSNFDENFLNREGNQELYQNNQRISSSSSQKSSNVINSNSSKKNPTIVQPKLSQSQPISRGRSANILSMNRPSTMSATQTVQSRQPPQIDTKDPYVIAAAEKLGISFSDLEYPTESDINTYTHNSEFRSYVRTRLCDQVDNLINQINQESESLKKDAKRPNTVPSNSREAPGGMSYYSIEEERLNRAEDRNRKEIEQLIIQSLIQQHQQEKMDQLAEYELQKQREYEEKMRQTRHKERKEMQ